MSWFRLVALSALLTAPGCKMNTSGVPRDAGDGGVTQDASQPADADLEPIQMTLEATSYPVDPTPANPVTGESAPPETEWISVVRYHAVNPRRPPQAVVLAYPGAQLGAGSYANLAQNLIVRSEGAIEVWAYERRGNTLEDRLGLEAARDASDVEVAAGYYNEGAEVDGHAFPGAPSSDVPSYMSEWGLPQEVQDLSMVLDFIDRADQPAHVLLLGFSLGAPVVSHFAAWDFDGVKGADRIAGLVMLDGGGKRTALTEAEYHHQGCVGSLGNAVGLDEMRAGGPYYQDLGMGAAIWIALEITGMRASGLYEDPTQEMHDPYLNGLLYVFLGKPGLRVSARAGLGLMVDDQFSPALVMRTGLGFVTGGPVEEYHNTIVDEDLLRPADATPLYRWADYDEVDPPEISSVTTAARLIGTGPTGALEWYAPVRLNLDVCAVDDLHVTESPDDYRWNMGLRVTRNAEMDAPVFFFFAEYGEIDDMAYVEAYRASLPPVGDGRPNAGAPRDPSLPPHESGFSLVVAPRFHHMDCLLAAPETGGTYLYDPLVDFILANTKREAFTARLP